MAQNETLTKQFLICRSDARLCALPLDHVGETMRSLPIDPMPGMPDFVLGASIVRDEVLPVVDISALLSGYSGRQDTRPARFVTLRLRSEQNAERRVVLAVDGVIGVRALEHATVAGIAPLLSDANARAVEAVTTLDAELLLVLRATHLIPDAVWQRINENLQKAGS